jgi:hypothetical protein
MVTVSTVFEILLNLHTDTVMVSEILLNLHTGTVTVTQKKAFKNRR